MELIKSQRGGLKLWHDGYTYSKKSSDKTRIRWNCTRKQARYCSAKIVTDIDLKSIFQQTPHSHPPTPDACIEFDQQIRDLATTSSAPPIEVYNQALNEVEKGWRDFLPCKETVLRRIRRMRQRNATKEIPMAEHVPLRTETTHQSSSLPTTSLKKHEGNVTTDVPQNIKEPQRKDTTKHSTSLPCISKFLPNKDIPKDIPKDFHLPLLKHPNQQSTPLPVKQHLKRRTSHAMPSPIKAVPSHIKCVQDHCISNDTLNEAFCESKHEEVPAASIEPISQWISRIKNDKMSENNNRKIRQVGKNVTEKTPLRSAIYKGNKKLNQFQEEPRDTKLTADLRKFIRKMYKHFRELDVVPANEKTLLHETVDKLNQCSPNLDRQNADEKRLQKAIRKLNKTVKRLESNHVLEKQSTARKPHTAREMHMSMPKEEASMSEPMKRTLETSSVPEPKRFKSHELICLPPPVKAINFNALLPSSTGINAAIVEITREITNPVWPQGNAEHFENFALSMAIEDSEFARTTLRGRRHRSLNEMVADLQRVRLMTTSGPKSKKINHQTDAIINRLMLL